jgi:hypothetical protein
MAVVAVKTTARVMGMSFIIPPNFEKIANGSSQANSYFIVSKTLLFGTAANLLDSCCQKPPPEPK